MNPTPTSSNWERFTLTILNLLALVAVMMVVVYLIETLNPSKVSELLIGMIGTVLGALIQNHGTSQGWWFAQSKGGSEIARATADNIATPTPPPVVVLPPPAPPDSTTTIKTETTQP